MTGVGRKNCVYGINNFVSSFLMSIELQQTIGYGERAPTDEVSFYKHQYY